MKLPVVAIVGRPNVGKSSLFNMLAGKRISIVEPTAGVTRDRITYTVEVGDRFVELMDTGGMGIIDHDNLTDDVEHQIRLAIEQAAVVLFVVDMRDGVMPLDQHVAEKLRGANKPVIFVANKADEPKIDVNVGDLFALGYGEPIAVSANSKRGRDELLAAIQHKLPADSPTVAPATPELKVAIVGRRNVGKSTFINSLAESDRVIVSEVAGTTRDSVDVRFERDGKAFIAIDTAGVRKKKSLASDIEYYGMHRAERSIRRADVVLHLFDPRLRISRVDKQLAEYILDNHKPAIFVVNKWDLAKDKIPTEKWADYLRKVFPMLDYVPIAFITATKGKNVYRLLNLAQQMHKQAGKRARTGELNRVLKEAMTANTPPVRFNRVPKMYFAAQVATHPPTVVMVTNGPDLFDRTYVKYLTKVVRDSFEFGEVPIRFILKTKGEASAYSDRKAFLAAQAQELASDEFTDEIPLLSEEQPADDHEPLRVDEPDDEEVEFDPADAEGDGDGDRPPPPERTQEVPQFKPEPVKKRKKPKPGTWDV
jgi:GTP-binding protein